MVLRCLLCVFTGGALVKERDNFYSDFTASTFQCQTTPTLTASLSFFSCQDLPVSHCHVAVHILVFLIPESLFSFTTVRHLEQEAAHLLKKPPSLKHIHSPVIRKNYCTKAKKTVFSHKEQAESHSHQLKRCADCPESAYFTSRHTVLYIC